MATVTAPLAVPDLPAPTWASRLLALAALLLALSCIAGGAPPPDSNTATAERSVKAAFLYKFLGYVEFQPDPGAQLVVGVLGADDIAAELAQLANGRSVNGKAITVRELKDGDALAGLHMLFVGADAPRPVQALRSAAQNSMLTVTETDNGLQLGSIINFRLVDERVRFEISLAAAEKSNVRLSSRLLSVAYHVQKASP